MTSVQWLDHASNHLSFLVADCYWFVAVNHFVSVELTAGTGHQAAAGTVRWQQQELELMVWHADQGLLVWSSTAPLYKRSLPMPSLIAITRAAPQFALLCDEFALIQAAQAPVWQPWHPAHQVPYWQHVTGVAVWRDRLALNVNWPLLVSRYGTVSQQSAGQRP